MAAVGPKPQLSVGEALKRPLFARARVSAGSRGLSRPVRWVHVLEAPENASFLKGGELILSTGVGFGEKSRKYLPFLEEVIRRKAAGLCIELGRFFPRIPGEMLELADHHGFPLISFTEPVHFVDITMDLHEHIINLHNKALRNLEDYSRELQKLSLQTQSLPRILLHFQAAVHSQAFLYSLDPPAFLGPNMPQEVQQEMAKVIRSRLLPVEILTASPGILSISAKKHLFYQPVTALGSVLAYLCVVLYGKEKDEYLHLTLDYTAGALAQILLRNMFAREQAFSHESRLMEEILRGGSQGSLEDALGFPRPDGKTSFWAVILQYQRDGSSQEETDSFFQEFLSIFRGLLTRRGFRPLVHSRGSRLYLLLACRSSLSKRADEVKRTLKDLENCCREALGRDGRLLRGASSSSPLFSGIRRAFAEAEQALGASRDPDRPFFSDLGVYRLLLSNPNRETLEAFAGDYLQPLWEHDKKHGTSYLDTLRVYLENNLNKKETAEALYIHRQTLYHRLAGITALLGVACLDPENRLSLEMAFRIRDCLEGGPAYGIVFSAGIR